MTGKLTELQRTWLGRIVGGENEGRGPLNSTFLSEPTWAVLNSLIDAGFASGVIMISSTKAGRKALEGAPDEQ